MVGLNTDLMQMLDLARDSAGVPFIITSGVRSVGDNIQAGGVFDSSHLKGLACDLACENSRNRYLILKALLQVGFHRIGVDKRHIHVDIDKEKDAQVFWIE